MIYDSRATTPDGRPRFKHFEDGNFELCSGRIGWAKRKTNDRAAVTCKNCLRILAKMPKTVTPITDDTVNT